MIKSNSYFTPALLLFLLEAYIARYVHDAIIRPFGGDFLAVIFLYCLVKSFFNLPVLKTALLVLIVAYAIELSQYFHLLSLLGMQHSKLITLLLGTSFSWTDMLCYTCGFTLILITEYFKTQLAGNSKKLKNQEQ